MPLPLVVVATQAQPRAKVSNYPAPFAQMMQGRSKRILGDLFGLANFGVNLTTLQPGSRSALQHRHSLQDEFIYAIEGQAVLVCGDIETILLAGMCAGFKAGGVSHHIENRGQQAFTYIEIGDRTGGDLVEYPDDDLVAVRGEQGWVFSRKNGQPY